MDKKERFILKAKNRDRSSGPAARELPLFLIACETISGEKRNTELSSGHSLRSVRGFFAVRKFAVRKNVSFSSVRSN